jgi:hypothetical protein
MKSEEIIAIWLEIMSEEDLIRLRRRLQLKKIRTGTPGCWGRISEYPGRGSQTSWLSR